MDIAVKVMLVASIILMGYNISQVVASYDAVCKKVDEFKEMAKEAESDDRAVKRSNFLMILVLSVIYVTIAFWCGFDYWIISVIALKFAISLWFSNMELTRIFKNGTIDRGFFMVSKVDELVNALMGLAVALILVL